SARAWRAPTNLANSFSNASATSPVVSHPDRRTARTASSSSWSREGRENGMKESAEESLTGRASEFRLGAGRTDPGNHFFQNGAQGAAVSEDVRGLRVVEADWTQPFKNRRDPAVDEALASKLQDPGLLGGLG